MQWLLIGAMMLLTVSCTTLSNRRDLYAPTQEYDTPAHTTTVRTTTITRTTTTPKSTPRPQPQGPITLDEEPVLPPP